MATASNKTLCIPCNKVKVTYICQGCSKHFCFDHLSQHRTNIQQQFDHLQNDHDQIRQQINELRTNSGKHPLIQQIDRWEQDSIGRIQQIAKQCRTRWIDYSNSCLRQMEKKLNHFAEQIKDIHQEDAFNEIDLNNLKQRLEILLEELNRSPNVSIEQQSRSFINHISLLLPLEKGKD